MQVGDIMTNEVKTIAPGDTLAEAAKVLRENRISAVVVIDGDAVAGIVTERDMVGVVAEGVDPLKVSVSEHMTTDLATAQRKTDVAEAARVMAERGIRHLPVVERGKLTGIISIRDLMGWAVQEITGGHELPDLERSQAALSAAMEARRQA